MPDLSGMREVEAAFILAKGGVEDWTVEWHEGTKPMVVIDHEPEAGDSVSDNSEVRIVLSGE